MRLDGMGERARIEAILDGRYIDAGVPPPMGHLEILALASEVRPLPHARRPLPSPLELAAWCGLRVVSMRRAAPFGMAGDGRTIYVPGEITSRTMGLGVARGIASWALSRRVGRHSGADVVLLAAEAVAPAEIVYADALEVLIARQPTIPPWFLCAWLGRISGSAEHPSART